MRRLSSTEMKNASERIGKRKEEKVGGKGMRLAQGREERKVKRDGWIPEEPKKESDRDRGSVNEQTKRFGVGMGWRQ